MEEVKFRGRIICGIIGTVFTIWGVVLLIKGDLTNGFLAMILGELVDLPYRIYGNKK